MSGAGLTLPAAGGGISDQTVAFAAELIDRSGKAPVIEAALAHRTGRPRPLPVRAVLTALLCLALDDRPLFLTDATRLLFQQLSGTSRRLLGVPGTASTERAFLAAYRRVRYCFGAICSVDGPLGAAEEPPPDRAGPQGPHQADDPRPGRGCPRPAGGVHQRPGRSQHLASSPAKNTQPTTAARAWTPPRSRCSAAARPGAPGCAPATRTAAGTSAKATTASARTTRASRCGRSAWALEATIATMARPPGAPPAHPNLAAGLALTRPGEDPGGTGARVLASVAARGHQPGWPGYDRAYTQALPGRFHLPARALGYHPVMDYRDDQLGIQANTSGASWSREPGTAPPCPGR